MFCVTNQFYKLYDLKLGYSIIIINIILYGIYVVYTNNASL